MSAGVGGGREAVERKWGGTRPVAPGVVGEGERDWFMYSVMKKPAERGEEKRVKGVVSV